MPLHWAKPKKGETLKNQGSQKSKGKEVDLAD
jgi:hypothetical protein